MKITVDVSDFYFDEDNFENSFKDYIIKDVVSQVNKAIEKKVEDHITRTVKNEIEQKLIYKINKQIDEIIATETIEVDKKQIPFSEHIKNRFLYNSGWSSPQEALKKLADQFGNELKKRKRDA
jgi:hypothetical protein